MSPLWYLPRPTGWWREANMKTKFTTEELGFIASIQEDRNSTPGGWHIFAVAPLRVCCNGGRRCCVCHLILVVDNI
jgi:hypothetical protein